MLADLMTISGDSMRQIVVAGKPGEKALFLALKPPHDDLLIGGFNLTALLMLSFMLQERMTPSRSLK